MNSMEFHHSLRMCQIGRHARLSTILGSLAVCLAVGVGHAHGAAADSEQRRFEQAHVHLQKGRIDEALEVYDSLAGDNADPARVTIGKSRCFEFRGGWKEATESIEAAVKVVERDPQLFARLAELYLAQGRFDEAGRSVAKAREMDADLSYARLVEADLWAATGQLKQADEGYHWFIKFYNQTQPEDSETLLVVARATSQYARWHGVPQIFDFAVNTLCPDALAKDNECWQAHWIAGMLLLEKYNRKDAIPALKLALAINPRAAEVHAALALAALQDHVVDEAANHIERALDANPRSAFALRVRADIQLEDGDVAGATRSLEQALAVNPRDEQALGRLAACRVLQDGSPTPAAIEALFARLDKIDQADVEGAGRFGELLASVVGWNLHPGVFLYAAGEQLDARKKYDMAERCYLQAVASMPQLSGPKSALGMLYMRTGKIAEGHRLLDQAFEADPYHVRVSNMRKVVTLLEKYDSITTEHFVIRVDSQADQILGRYMADFLEAEYPALVRQFGYEPPVRTQFEVYNKAKGLSAHQWFSARMVGLPWVQTIGASTGMIVALASPTAGGKPFNWARVVKHEFVHILTLQETNFNIPHWFTEALAVRSEDSPRPEKWNQLLVERVPRGDVMDLDTINHGFSRAKSDDDWQMAYCQSRLYLEYMVDKFDSGKPAQLLAAYRNGLSTDQAIPQTFGVEKGAFEQGYRGYLEAIVAKLPNRTFDPPLTPAMAEKEFRAHPDDTRAAARFAYELFKRGNRNKEARKIAQAALEANPSEPLAAVVMARLELRSEDSDAAIAWLEPALNRDDPHPRVLELLAELRFKQNDFSTATQLFELGLAHDPDHVDWMKGLAASLRKNADYEKLKPVLERLVLADGDNAAPRRMLARMALDNEEFAQAVHFARLALHIDVLDAQTHRVLALGYVGLKQYAQAVDEWTIAVRLNPDEQEFKAELARAKQLRDESK
jgi:tetratricopeptide (TPR) repeat protein